MNLTEFFKQSGIQINNELEDVTYTWRKNIVRNTPQLVGYYDLFTERLYGGKVFRGSLVILGYHLTGNRKKSDITKIAAAIELIHNSLLILDDIIDKSETRRGKTSLYNAFGNDHVAISQALCLEDLGLFLANKLIIETKFPYKRILQFQSVLAETVMLTAMGEMLDIEVSHENSLNSYKSVLTIHKFKTAYYSVAMPLMAGIMLGGGSKKMQRDIQEFGINLGIVFQIRDDILGIFGDETVLGKSVTSDIEEGKNTLLIVYAKKYGNEEQRIFLDTHYGKGKLTQQTHRLIKEIFSQTGALAYSQRRINVYMSKAKKILSQIECSDEAKTLLYELIEYLENRKK
jgi:geranylgeranyl pyrophosphate synthase